MAKYLDINGLAEVWAKMKSHVSSGYVSKTGDASISGSLSVDRAISSSSLGTGMISSTGSTNIPGIYFSGTAVTYGSSSLVASDTKYEIATKNDIRTAVADLVNSAPEALNTLGELADALHAHEDEYDALLETIGNKADAEHTHSYLPLTGGSINGSLSVKSLNATAVQTNSYCTSSGSSGAMITTGSNNSKFIYATSSTQLGDDNYEIATKKDLANIQLETLTTAEIEEICV